MQKILVIDESPLFREYLGKKLTEYGFDVVLGVNGLDGAVKLRNETPDLVIMDFFLSRNNSIELLQKKKSDPNTAAIPVIMVSSKVDREKILQVGQFNVRKFFTKPVKIDSLLRSISELLGVTLNLDNTVSIIEAHVNDEILFVEIAQGLNKEKIDLLKYKIAELIDLYEIAVPKVLVMMSNIQVTADDTLKLSALFSNLVDATRVKQRFVKVLTNSEYIRQFLRARSEYAEIEVTNNLEKAMDGLLGRKTGTFLDAKSKTVQHEFLLSTAPRKDKEESLHLRFDDEMKQSTRFDLTQLDKSIRIVVVDDDQIIQELIRTAFSDTQFQIETYSNGRKFMDSPDALKADLIFLDLMMPEMDGFQVMEELSERKLELPIIILSALSQRETVLKALGFGVISYLIKPLKPEGILKKATEVLGMNF
ncbi:MAG TPA: response regulator [Spirochaetia bacterium]|nr:response regulator [Spirochaetia bacterium]